MDGGKKTICRQINPVTKANVFSQVTFWWLTPIFRSGLKTQLEENDLYAPLPEHESGRLGDSFEALWKKEISKPQPSLLRIIFKCYWLEIIIYGFLFSAVETTLRVAQPLLLGGLINYFVVDQTSISETEAYLCAVGIIISVGIPVFSFHPYLVCILHVGLKIKVASCSLIYRKALRMSKTSTAEGLTGQVINLISNDVNQFDLAAAFFHDLWRGPVDAILYGYFMYREMGVSALFGVAFMILFIPMQGWLGKKSGTLRFKTAVRTDARVNLMNEIITGIQVIKMYTWEKTFAKLLSTLRRKEINIITSSSYVRATMMSFGKFMSRAAIFICIVSYLYLGNSLSASQVFIVISFFNVLGFSLVEMWPLAITFVSEGYVSVKRIESFLKYEELQQHDAKAQPCEDLHSDEVVVFDKVTASWSEESNAGIYDADLKLRKGRLSAIVGPVGSGKSSLLNVILKELPVREGALKINGSVSYCAQEPWLFEGSVRNNILFGEQFNENRYLAVVNCCALERDLELFQYGDKTIVGERGISLSGGQRARINLARAVYKDSDIYLLDDPLSAVDTNVGKQLFEECVTGKRIANSNFKNTLFLNPFRYEFEACESSLLYFIYSKVN